MRYFDLGLRGSPIGFSGFGIRDSPYLMAGIRGIFKHTGGNFRAAENNHRDYGIEGKFGTG